MSLAARVRRVLQRFFWSLRSLLRRSSARRRGRSGLAGSAGEWHGTVKTDQFYAHQESGPAAEMVYLIEEYSEYWYTKMQFGNGLVKGRVSYYTGYGWPVYKLADGRFQIHPPAGEPFAVVRAEEKRGK